MHVCVCVCARMCVCLCVCVHVQDEDAETIATEMQDALGPLLEGVDENDVLALCTKIARAFKVCMYILCVCACVCVFVYVCVCVEGR